MIDSNTKYITHRLYRQHTSVTNTGFVKDLSKLGRELTKIIMIDNLADNFRLQTNNGICCRTWTEDMKDTQLNDFSRLLKSIHSFNPFDVRFYVKKIKEEANSKLCKNVLNPFSKIELKQ